MEIQTAHNRLALSPTIDRLIPAWAILLLICVSTASCPRVVRAGDIESARQQLAKVKVDIDNASWDSVDQDIKTTEEFLDGVPDADRAPVQKELDALKEKASAGMKEFKSKAIAETAKRNLDAAADHLTDEPQRAMEFLDKANAQLNGDDAKKYLEADQLAKLKARSASLQKMSETKVVNQKMDFANPIVKELDDAMAAQPFKNAKTNEDMDHATQEVNALMSRVRASIDGIPATDPRVKAITDKLAGYDKQVQAATGNAMAAQAAQQLAHQWQSEQEYFAGWDQEKQGPSWDDYTHKQSESNYNLGMPKTVVLLTRMHGWFTEDAVKSTAEQYKNDASVQATLAEAHKAVDTAAAKLHAAFNSLLDDAEKSTAPPKDFSRERIEPLIHSADNWFAGTPYHDQDVARATRIHEKWLAVIANGAAAQEASLAKLTAQAAAAWPAIAAGIKADDNFTPDKLDQYKGKIIHLTGNNRLGYDYMPSGYRFARDINGMPVAGKYDANVKAAVAAVTAETGQDLPDESWDVYAVVEGPGKIQQRTSSEGKVKIDGQDVGTVKSEGTKSVDCAVVRIIALHAGPVAVGTGGGAGTAAVASGDTGTGAAVGSTAATAVATGFSVIRLLEHLAELALCIAAAGLVVMKSRAPAAQPAATGAGSVSTPVASNDNIALAGLAIAILGFLWLISKLIFGDLLPAGALTLSGIYVASDWLKARNIIPQSLRDSIKPLAVPIAGATVLFGFFHMFLAHWYLF